MDFSDPLDFTDYAFIGAVCTGMGLNHIFGFSVLQEIIERTAPRTNNLLDSYCLIIHFLTQNDCSCTINTLILGIFCC
jgi:hypothetical protein